MATILIVDDASFMRMTLRSLLEHEGHTIVGEAENGSEAVKLYRQLKPDVVTMDIVMPDMGGIESAKSIRSYDPDAKIIICSALGESVHVKEAIRAGATDFIVKPVSPNRLSEALDRLTAS